MISITTTHDGTDYTIDYNRNTDAAVIYKGNRWAGEGTAREYAIGMWTIDDCAAVLDDGAYDALDAALTARHRGASRGDRR